MTTNMAKQICVPSGSVHFHPTSVLAATLIVMVLCMDVQAASLLVQKQMSPMRHDSIKISPTADSTLDTHRADSHQIEPMEELTTHTPVPELNVGTGYDPSGRRDPFAPVVQELQPGKVDENLPPLQRVTLTELNLVAIVWGAYGYTAMVQTPEGHGYTIRRGTRIGQNYGVVSAITERGIIVQERFTDVYGKKQEREYVKLLHPKEGLE
jgi:type IV pilus assembly protein PilP